MSSLTDSGGKMSPNKSLATKITGKESCYNDKGWEFPGTYMLEVAFRYLQESSH